MTNWVRFDRDGGDGFGKLVDQEIEICSGDMFSANEPTGERVMCADVRLKMPCAPTKVIALWNNFHEAAAKQELSIPEAPLFFIKPPNTYRASGDTISIPAAAGRVLYEGELAIVIGRRGSDLDEATAAAHIFGYTCLNDVTALAILKADQSFAQWTRSKGLDGFCPFGPAIATELDPEQATLRTLVNGRERQSYRLGDMVFAPAKLVSLISQGMTLEPGDLIACGTSLGAGPIPKGATVDVIVDGIGTLTNRFE